MKDNCNLNIKAFALYSQAKSSQKTFEARAK
jgi:hypothetical protein